MIDLAERIAANLQLEAEPFGIVVQVVEDADQVYIYLNRPPEMDRECAKFVAILKQKLRRDFGDLPSVYVLSRIMGEEQPDWQEQLSLMPETTQFLCDDGVDSNLNIDFLSEPENDAPPEIEPETTPPLIELKSFCFTRNRQLLEGDIDRPAKKVIEKIKSFHTWEQRQQVQLLEFLKLWFADPNGDYHQYRNLSEEGKAWIVEMQADKELVRSLKVWLSRYCYDAPRTISEVGGETTSQPHNLSQNFNQNVKKTDALPSMSNLSAKPAKTSSSRSPQAGTIKKSKSVSDAPSSVTNSVIGQTSQAFSQDEIPSLIVTVAVVGVFAWLLSGAVSAFGWLGFLMGVVSIVAGFAGTLGDKLIGGICSILLLVFYVLLPIFLVLWFELLGGAIGFFTAMGMKTAAKDAPLFAGKPLRILMAALAVVFVIQGTSLLQSSEVGSGNAVSVTVRGTVLPEYRASGSITIRGKSTNLRGAIVRSFERGRILYVMANSEPITTADVENAKTAAPNEEMDIFSSDSSGVSAYVTIFLSQNRKPTRYLVQVVNREASRVGAISTMRGFTYAEANLNASGLNITELEPKEDGKVKLSLITFIGRRDEVAINCQLDTKIVGDS